MCRERGKRKMKLVTSLNRKAIVLVSTDPQEHNALWIMRQEFYVLGEGNLMET